MEYFNEMQTILNDTYELIEQSEEDIDFPICLSNENNNQFVKTNCNHSFHKECIDTWFVGKKNFPLCRTIIKNKQATLANILAALSPITIIRSVELWLNPTSWLYINFNSYCEYKLQTNEINEKVEEFGQQSRNYTNMMEKGFSKKCQQIKRRRICIARKSLVWNNQTRTICFGLYSRHYHHHDGTSKQPAIASSTPDRVLAAKKTACGVNCSDFT
ncbi:uncharacterized protein LOC126184113 [Schistocerca cancellata]|uniref:uncharacterized protein LOC126184113 n=1 Tax=Schistocerca cancellata TaxID=274614 RepID=UPI002118A25C|nr:uncharacterized protein LOC126184113 [Schistocerca cancellata]